MTIHTHDEAQPEERKCAECAHALKGRQKLFCSPVCSRKWHQRNLTRGQVVLPYLMAWRGHYGKTDVAKFSMSEGTQLLDAWNREDKAAGRLPMAKYIETQVMGQCKRAFDQLRTL